MEIIIQFDKSYSVWKDEIKKVLDNRNIIFSESMLANIIKSIQYKVDNYLDSLGYKIIHSFKFRKDLCYSLSSCGLLLQITSNALLWKYLEYFTDIEDYSSAISVQLAICDTQRALDSSTNLRVMSTSEAYHIHNIRSDIRIKKALDDLKFSIANSNSNSSQLIYFILENLVEEVYKNDKK